MFAQAQRILVACMVCIFLATVLLAWTFVSRFHNSKDAIVRVALAKFIKSELEPSNHLSVLVSVSRTSSSDFNDGDVQDFKDEEIGFLDDCEDAGALTAIGRDRLRDLFKKFYYANVGVARIFSPNDVELTGFDRGNIKVVFSDFEYSKPSDLNSGNYNYVKRLHFNCPATSSDGDYALVRIWSSNGKRDSFDIERCLWLILKKGSDGNWAVCEEVLTS